MWSLPASLHLPGAAFLQPRKSPVRNLDNGPESLVGASMLGVGHFTVPPDVIVEGPAGCRRRMATSPRHGPQSAPSSYPTASPPCRGVRRSRRANARRGIQCQRRMPGRACGQPRVDHRPGLRRIKADALAGRLFHLGDVACRVVILVLLFLAAWAARADLTPRCANGCVAANAGLRRCSGRRRTPVLADVR